MGLRIGGFICLLDKMADVRLIPEVGVEASADVFVSLTVIRGGIELELQLFKFALSPVITVSIKDGFDANLRAYLIVTGPRFCIIGYVAFPFPKFCGPVPCGIHWDTRKEAALCALPLRR